jgi:hypothetical protein
MGPLGEDFRAAFGLGESDVGIHTIDADGVALSAIQGLNATLESMVVEPRSRGCASRAGRRWRNCESWSNAPSQASRRTARLMTCEPSRMTIPRRSND